MNQQNNYLQLSYKLKPMFSLYWAMLKFRPKYLNVSAVESLILKLFRLIPDYAWPISSLYVCLCIMLWKIGQIKLFLCLWHKSNDHKCLCKLTHRVVSVWYDTSVGSFCHVWHERHTSHWSFSLNVVYVLLPIPTLNRLHTGTDHKAGMCACV